MSFYFFLILFFSVCICFADITSSYNVGIEVHEVNAERFSDYVLQYNDSPNDEKKWRDLTVYNHENDSGDYYFSTGLNINKKIKSQKLLFRLRSKCMTQISEEKSLTVFSKRTNFLKLYIEDGTNYTSSSYLRHINLLPYYEMKFHLKEYSKSLNDWLFLITPAPLFNTNINVEIKFGWTFNQSFTNFLYSSYLLIGTNDYVEISRINVTGLNQYNFYFDGNNFEEGYYWWQIIFQIDNKIIGSEIRPFYLGNCLDSDCDGYCDKEEIYRGSNHLDINDIPLVILSDQICPKGYLYQQYYLRFNVNIQDRFAKWKLLGELPSGLLFSDRGYITGIPKQVGDYIFDIEVSNIDGKIDQKRFHINIDNALPSLIKLGKGNNKNF